MLGFVKTANNAAWKVSVFGVFQVRIQSECGKIWTKKLRIRTLSKQCYHLSFFIKDIITARKALPILCPCPYFFQGFPIFSIISRRTLVIFEMNGSILRYFNFEPSFKLRWCRARDLFESQIPVITGGFELQISCIRRSYLPIRLTGHWNLWSK